MISIPDDESTNVRDSREAEDTRERYAREHPAGYLASRPRPPATERVGHPLIRDEAGYGPYGSLKLPTGEREFTRK